MNEKPNKVASYTRVVPVTFLLALYFLPFIYCPMGTLRAEWGSRTPLKVSLRSGGKTRVPGPQGGRRDAAIGKKCRVEAEKGKAQL